MLNGQHIISERSAARSVRAKAAAPRRRARNALAIVSCLYLLGPISTDLMLAVLPQIVIALGAIELGGEAVLSSLLFGTALGCLVAGPLCDALGRKLVVLVSLCLYAPAAFASAFVHDLAVFSFWRAVQGFAGAFAVVAGMAIISDMLGRTQAAQANGRLISAMFFAVVFLPAIGAAVALFATWRGSVAVAGLYALVIAAVVAAFLPETLPKRHRRPLRALSFLHQLTLFANPVFSLNALAGAFSIACVLAFIVPFTFIVRTTLGLSELIFVLCFATLPLAVAVGSYLSSLLCVRIGVERTLLLGCTAELLSGAALYAQHGAGLVTLPGLVATSVALAVGAGLALPASQVAAVKACPQAAGSASALYRMLGMLVSSIATQLALAEYGRGLATSSMVIITCALAAIGLCCCATRTRTREHATAGGKQAVREKSPRLR